MYSPTTLTRSTRKITFIVIARQLEELVDLPTKSTDELEQLQDRLRCLDEDKIRLFGLDSYSFFRVFSIGKIGIIQSQKSSYKRFVTFTKSSLVEFYFTILEKRASSRR